VFVLGAVRSLGILLNAKLESPDVVSYAILTRCGMGCLIGCGVFQAGWIGEGSMCVAVLGGAVMEGGR
jgi:hypothetical protein